MLDVVTFGEILWDVIDGEAHIGGAPFNLAAHTVRCGLRAAAVSCVGDDALGRAALDEMSRLGVDRRWTAVDVQHPTGTVTVKLSGGGQPTYTIHENVAWDYIQVPESALETMTAERPRVFCFGTLAQRNAVSRDTLSRLLDRFAFTEIFFDVNLRQTFWSAETVEAGLARSTLVKVNDDEARVLGGLLFGGACSPEAFARAVLDRHPVRAVVVTLGADGCLVCERGRDAFVHCPGVRVEVVDAVGAGDAFSAAFLAAWLKGAPAFEAAQAGNRRGAWVASRPGAIPDEDGTVGVQ